MPLIARRPGDGPEPADSLLHPDTWPGVVFPLPTTLHPEAIRLMSAEAGTGRVLRGWGRPPGMAAFLVCRAVPPRAMGAQGASDGRERPRRVSTGDPGTAASDCLPLVKQVCGDPVGRGLSRLMPGPIPRGAPMPRRRGVPRGGGPPERAWRRRPLLTPGDPSTWRCADRCRGPQMCRWHSVQKYAVKAGAHTEMRFARNRLHKADLQYRRPLVKHSCAL